MKRSNFRHVFRRCEFGFQSALHLSPTVSYATVLSTKNYWAIINNLTCTTVGRLGWYYISLAACLCNTVSPHDMRFILLGTVFFYQIVQNFASDNASNFLDVKLALELRHVPRICRHKTTPCKLSYAMSVLQNRHYDLHTVMLQDGHLTADQHKRYLHEHTVINIPASAMQNVQDGLFLGIKIFDLPPGVQDYFVIDASRALNDATEKSKTVTQHSKITFNAVITKGRTHVERTISNGCECHDKTCTCCEHLDVPTIHLNHSACLNLTIIPADYALEIVATLDGDVLYNDTLSARNPPPFCLHAPFLKEYAAVCIRFTQIRLGHHHLHMCITSIAELYHVPIMEHSFGCVNLPY